MLEPKPEVGFHLPAVVGVETGNEELAMNEPHAAVAGVSLARAGEAILWVDGQQPPQNFHEQRIFAQFGREVATDFFGQLELEGEDVFFGSGGCRSGGRHGEAQARQSQRCRGLIGGVSRWRWCTSGAI